MGASEGTPAGSGLDEQRAARRAKLDALVAAGLRPYADRYPRTHDLVATRRAAEAVEGPPAGDGDLVRTAGRVLTIRPFGRLVFLHLQDGSGRCQVALDAAFVGDEALERFGRFVDLGDHLGVEGRVGRTRKGEPTLFATTWTFLSKALRPLPEKWSGLTDLEARQRERYLDLITNPGTRQRFRLRTRFVRGLRSYLDAHGFEEVDTPVLQTKASGALARPFLSHHNALDMPLYLRIANELYLKRLIVGGFDGVFEFAKDFRNEGMSRFHNPEFTQVELYVAYKDYHWMMEMTENLIAAVAQRVNGSTKTVFGEHEVDFKPPWPRLSIYGGIEKYTGKNLANASEAGLFAAAKALVLRDQTP